VKNKLTAAKEILINQKNTKYFHKNCSSISLRVFQ